MSNGEELSQYDEMLARCPVCGSKSFMDGRWFACCSNVDCQCSVMPQSSAEDAIAAWNHRTPPQAPITGATCDACHGPALTWFAPNALWNLVKGGADATDDPGGMLCPNCFIILAEAAGIVPTAWVLDTAVLPTEEGGAADRAPEKIYAAILSAIQTSPEAGR